MAMAVKSLPPRPSVVISPLAVSPWKPASITMLPSSSIFFTASGVMFTMRAFVCTRSVEMPACAPVRDTALPPRALMAIAVRAIVVCSPVARSTSISRSIGSRSRETSLASLIRLSVTPDMADTTATTWLPARCVSKMRRAQLRMRSGFPTEVPPYFCTMRAMLGWGKGRGQWHAAAARQEALRGAFPAAK